MKWTNSSYLDYPEMWPKMSCTILCPSHTKNILKRPLLAYDQKYSSGMCLEETKTLVLLPHNNNDHSGTILTHKDRMCPNIIHPTPHNGWTTLQSPWTLTETEPTTGKETTAVKETTTATITMDKGTTTAIKATETSITPKGMLPQQGTPRTPALTVAKKGTSLETAQSAAKTISTIKWPT